MSTRQSGDEEETQLLSIGAHHPLQDAPSSVTTTMASTCNSNSKKKMYPMIHCFVFAFSILVSVYFTFFTAPKPVWFHLHPLLCALGFYSFFASAVVLKKQMKTRQHANFMFLGTGLAVLGVWIAFQDKSSRGKSHFVSTHALLGLGALCLAIPFPLLSWVLLNPDSGWRVGDQRVRKLHTWLGKLVLAVSFIAFGFGIAKYEKNPYFLTVLLVAMSSVSPWVLI